MNKEKIYPLVSIIIPVYNGSNYLEQAINSAIKQTYPNLEIIVVNDGSTDDNATQNIALGFGDKIRYFHKSNGGVSSALNYGIKQMKGEYFSWLSHDDLYNEQKLEKQIGLIKNLDIDNAICFSNHNIIGTNSLPIKFSNIMKKIDAGKITNSMVFRLLISKGSISGCSFLIPKTLIQKFGGFDENLMYSQDLFLWLKLCLSDCNFCFVNEPLVSNRLHKNQMMNKISTCFKKDLEYIFDSLKDAIISQSTKKDNLLFFFAKFSARYCCESVTKKCIKVGKENGLINLGKIFRLKIISYYGIFRPKIRKIYYHLKGIKT